MESKSWASVSRATCLAALVACAGIAFPQATGRFSDDGTPQLPGFAWTPQGFRAADSNGLLFRFEDVATSVKLASATSRTAEWTVEGGRHTPTALRVNLRSPGFEMKVKSGFRFTLDSLRPPLFTTAIGTYEGAPAPPSRWIMVSLRENVPPVLFSFRQGVSELRATGSAGQWEVRFSPAYEGWVRVILPFGQRVPPSSETLVERLGREAAAVQSLAPLATGPSPKILSQRILENRGAMRIEWTFDAPGAVLPSAPLLAGLSTGAQVSTPYRLVSDAFSEGPLAVGTGTVQSIYLPLGLLPLGRALTSGHWENAVPKDEIAINAAAPEKERDSLPDAVLSLYSALERSKGILGSSEAYRPTSSASAGAFAAAANRQAWWINQGLLPDSSALALHSLLWRVDPLTWTLASGLENQAMAARAALLSGAPEKRIEGLMLAYGLLAQNELASKRARLGFAPGPPVPGLPDDLRVMLGLAPPGKDWTRLLAAPFWLQSGPPAWLRKGDRTWVLLFMGERGKPVSMIFRTRTPVQFQGAANLLDLQSARLGDSPGAWRYKVTAKPSSKGLVEIRLITPESGFVMVPTTLRPR